VTSENIVVAVCEMTSTESVEDNFRQIKELFGQAVAQQAQLLSFPENSLYLRINEQNPKFGLAIDHPTLQELTGLCRENEVAIHLGSVPLAEGDGIWNSTLWIDERGEIERVYDKMHLFDIELEGKKPIRESDIYEFGQCPVVIEWRGFRFGLSICYDLRFAELYSYYARQNVDAVLVPAAFLVETGRAHWEILLRARAIESQCYVIAAAQQGTHKAGAAERATWGRSMIVDPWGEVMGEADETHRMVIAQMSHQRIKQVRQQIPMHSHRRWQDVRGSNG
jgi:predicted amidohydrolase